MIEGCVIGIGQPEEDGSEEGVFAHHRVRASLSAFACRFDQLTPEQQQAVETTARKAMALETRILASPEAWEIFLPEATVDEAFETVQGRYETRADFEADLAANGLDAQSLRLALSRDLWVDAVLNRVVDNILPPGPAEARRWYETHPERFTRPEQRTARHILVTVNGAFADNHRDKAWDKIETIHGELDGSMEQFEQMALKHSECPTALEGGKLGTVPRGQLYQNLDDSLFAMETGAVSDVLESEMGFHILLCEAIHPEELMPFAKAKQKILDHLFARKRHTAQRQWIDGLAFEQALSQGG